MVWCKNLFRALLVYKVQVLPVHCFPKRPCRRYSWGYKSNHGVQQSVFWKKKGVAKIDWSTLLIISSMECIIYWASNKSVHKQSTQQRFLFLGAFNVDGSPFLLFIINHNALTVLLEPASVLTALCCWVPFPRNPGTDKVGGTTCSLSICAAAFIPHPCKLFIKETITSGNPSRTT